MVYVLSNSISNGARVGIAAILGVASGAFCYVLLAIAGVATLIAASPLLYGLLVLAGAGYLCWLGLGMLRSRETAVEIRGGIKASFWQVYRRGLMTNLLNPKAMIFTISFMPQFVPEYAANKTLSMLYLGIVLVVIMILVASICSTLTGRSNGFGAGSPTFLSRPIAWKKSSRPQGIKNHTNVRSVRPSLMKVCCTLCPRYNITPGVIGRLLPSTRAVPQRNSSL